MNLVHWLRKLPRPVALMADDKRVEVPKSARAWRDLVATVESLDPSKLTALDGDGNVIRSIVLEDESKPAGTSPEMPDLQLFARLLAEGYEHGRKANQPIIDSAMSFVERQSTRLSRAETENDRLRAENHRLRMQLAELSGAPASSGDDSLLSTIMAGALQAAGSNPLANLASIKPAGGKK